jgi:8-oxo-dGTP pyrophosphatase MutT (NUDIX family)
MSPSSESLVANLQRVLAHSCNYSYPYIPNPEGCKKRASVAVILRVRAPYHLNTVSEPSDIPPTSFSIIENSVQDRPTSTDSALKKFFSQGWVQDGDPEILFIKRISRVGDRWSGHVALPGGGRDPEDEDDLATAVRETREEVGLDLTLPGCLNAGNLPQRVVTTTWGKEALMVLCPFIFILTERITPPLQPQPTEVAAIHWIPLRALLSPNMRTRELVDISSRFARQGGPIIRKVFRVLVGKMMFSAVKLIPSESLYASSVPGFIPEGNESAFFSGLATGAFGIPSSTTCSQPPLILWGLTLGVLADFLDMLPPHNAVKLWKYPTFTVLDLRIFVYLFTRSLRKNNAGDLSAGTWPSQTAVDATSQAMAVSEAEPSKLAHNEAGISGLGIGPNPNHAVGKMLSGYYDRMNVAIGAFLMYRVLLGSAMTFWIFKLWRQQRR